MNNERTRKERRKARVTEILDNCRKNSNQVNFPKKQKEIQTTPFYEDQDSSQRFLKIKKQKKTEKPKNRT